MVIDTGSSFGLTISETCAARLKLELATNIPDTDVTPGRPALGRTAPCDVDFFGNRLRRYSLGVFRIQEDTDSIDGEIDGLIGWPALRGEVLALFLARREYDAVDGIPPDAESWVKWTVVDSDVLVLRADQPDAKCEFIIDTGAPDGILLSKPDWRKWKVAHPAAPAGIAMGSMFGDPLHVTEEAWAEAFDIGGVRVTNLPVSEAGLAYHLDEGKDIKRMVVGRAALARLELIVDTRAHVAYVRPSHDPAPRYPHNMVGVVFTPDRQHHDQVVAHVYPGGPAARAGLEDGDVLVRVGKENARSWNDYRKLSYLRSDLDWENIPDGTRIDFSVLRKDRESTVSVTAMDQFNGEGAP